MPSLFSKPVVAAGFALVIAALSAPLVPTGQLVEYPWTPCGTNTYCTDMYFCQGIWENLTMAPRPPTATGGYAYGYRTNTSGCIPGASPIMRVQPGTTYKVMFHNTADMDPAFVDPNSTTGSQMVTAWDPSMDPTLTGSGQLPWGQLNLPMHTTNLHLHGAHISGMGDHDYVLRPVNPGQCQIYIYNVGADTPGGMHIYHPHAHGRVAYQFLGGAFGPWIIEDFNAAGVSNGIGKDLNGKPVDQPVKNFLSFRSVERVLNAYAEFGTRMGNGDPAGAAMNMTANQWFRWRIIHAKAEGTLGFTTLKDIAGNVLAWNTTVSPKCEVYELANDGVYLSKVPYQPYKANGATSQYEFWVHGAERLELAIRCLSAGSFTIDYEGATVARVTVLATPKTNPYPQTLVSPFAAGGKLQWTPNRPNWLSDLRAGTPTFPKEVKTFAPLQVIRLGFDGINGVLWEQATGPIYNAQFDPTIVYEMLFINTGVHPTHMHLQHMQIVTPGGCGGLKEGEFYDTATTLGPGNCNVRVRWINFTGPVVMHCHVLDHEDMGILGYIWVPFKAPGSFEASNAFSSNSKPGFCCTPRVDAKGNQVCRNVAQCGASVGINTCNQPCTVPVNACPAKTPYCSTTGVCFATIKNAEGNNPIINNQDCSAPVYPYVVMAVGLAVAAIAVVSAVCIVRRKGSATLSTILLEEMKQESRHVPSCNYSPFPSHP